MCKLKKAFTMIELVVVIVVVGILAAILMPRFDRNALLEAADQVVSHIRYTQHLALSDDVYDPADSNWYKKRWTISFNRVGDDADKWRYSVYKDITLSGNLNSSSEVARDPLSPNKYMTSGWSGIANNEKTNTLDKYNLSSKFGVKEIFLSGGCPANTKSGGNISFDNKGVPYRSVSTTGGGGAENSVDRMINSDCNITLVNDGPTAKAGNQAVITITPETGYVRIIWFPGCENTPGQPNRCIKPADRTI